MMCLNVHKDLKTSLGDSENISKQERLRKMPFELELMTRRRGFIKQLCSVFGVCSIVLQNDDDKLNYPPKKFEFLFSFITNFNFERKTL